VLDGAGRKRAPNERGADMNEVIPLPRTTTTPHDTAFAARRFLADRRGGVALYTALVGTLVMGSLVLGVDVGRMTVLQAQMQNAADAAALAASAQLDGLDGARDRAEAVARSTASDSSGLTIAAGAFAVDDVEFFSDYGDSPVEATNDQDAAFIRVTMAPEDMQVLFEPVMRILGGGTGSSVSTIAANAVAGTDPIVCNAPPFMLCDFTEDEDIAIDILDDSSAGRQVLMKPQGGGGFAPGNYGLLCVDGDCGASAINAALVAVESGACSGTDVETATGSKTNQIRDGLNARFDKGSADPRNPARNVINYPRDTDMTSSTLVGNGIWDVTGYWLAKHGTAVPVALANATRYQVYLYELDETFARSDSGLGKRTIYPIDGALPAGFVEIDPPGEDIPVDASNPNDNDFDGVPVSTPVEDPERRVVVAAIVQCVAQGVRGHGEHPAAGYVFMFLTETVSDPPNADVYAEVIGPFNADTSPDFHVNARLFE
jgi:Flp pilus assembly protein TadG